MPQERLTIPARIVKTIKKLAWQEQRTPEDIVELALEQYDADLAVLRRVQKAFKKAGRKAGLRSQRDVDRLVHEHRAGR